MNRSEHLLTCLSEECIEVAKDIHKALRFGLDDRNVMNPTGPTNRERIIQELNDLEAVLRMCQSEGILPEQFRDEKAMESKRHKVEKFIEYAKDQGALQTV